MRSHSSRHVVYVATLLAMGCGLQPATTALRTGAATAAFGDVISARYRTLAGLTTPVLVGNAAASSIAAVTTLDSSSVRDPRWWDVGNVIDGNVHSAWTPARRPLRRPQRRQARLRSLGD